MKRKNLDRLKAALAADSQENQTNSDLPNNKKYKTLLQEPVPGPSRLANYGNIDPNVAENIRQNLDSQATAITQQNKPKKNLKRPALAEAFNPKRRRTRENESKLGMKPTQLEKDVDSIDFDIRSFRQEVVVLDNDQIKIVLKKVAFKKQNKFKYSDHLFEVSFLPKASGQAPLLLDLLDFFRLVIVKIVLMLRRYYNEALSSSSKKKFMKVHRQI